VYQVAKYSRYCEEFIEASKVTKDHLLNCMSGHCLFAMNEDVNKGIVAVLPFRLF